MKRKLELNSVKYQGYLRAFAMMLNAVGYGVEGQEAMLSQVKEYLHYLEQNGITNLNKIEPLDMVAYFEHLCQRPNLLFGGVLSSSTINGHLCAIELFNDHLLERGIITKTLTLPKMKNAGDKQHRQILTLDEIQALYSVTENKRDLAILALAYGCGLRKAEISKLAIADIQLSQGILIVRQGKFSKRREIPLTDRIINDLKDYLINERNQYQNKDKNNTNETFLVNNLGKPANGDWLNKRLRQLIAKLNKPEVEAKEITLHCLRHSISTHLLEAGAGIEFVRDFLGHAEIDTVHVYARRRKMKQQLINKIK